jgi:hypothetical protein
MTTPFAPAPRTWSDLDPYLKAAHLKTAIVPATIERIDFQTVHPRPGQEEIKPVMYFVGKQKGLILTSTNQDFPRATFGDEITASYGKLITLRAVRKTIAGRGIDTVIIGLAAEDQPKDPEKILKDLGFPPKK